MNTPFHELPVLPVVVPLGLVIFAVFLWRLWARRLLSIPRGALAAAVAIYAAGITANTVFPIYLDKPPRTEPWTPALALIPFVDYEVHDALINVVVFIPLGILVALVLERPVWWKVVVIALGASLAIELLQLAVQALFLGGHVADVNDLIFNVSGAAFGLGLYLLATRIPVIDRFADKFRWAPEE